MNQVLFTDVAVCPLLTTLETKVLPAYAFYMDTSLGSLNDTVAFWTHLNSFWQFCFHFFAFLIWVCQVETFHTGKHFTIWTVQSSISIRIFFFFEFSHQTAFAPMCFDLFKGLNDIFNSDFIELQQSWIDQSEIISPVNDLPAFLVRTSWLSKLVDHEFDVFNQTSLTVQMLTFH